MENKKSKRQILVVVEGAKTDVNLMKHLFEIYGLSERHQIVSYKTNIYELYEKMFKSEYSDPENIDTLQFFKEHEKNLDEKKKFDGIYSDILLIFDFDPQDNRFSDIAIRSLLKHFGNSTENGKLYINYPMVEAFYHVKSIPDLEFNTRYVELKYLDRKNNPEHKNYKQIVNKESCASDYSKFPLTRKECNILIKQNIEKAKVITNSEEAILKPELILNEELKLLEYNHLIYVLCTCVFYIWEYNSDFLEKN